MGIDSMSGKRVGPQASYRVTAGLDTTCLHKHDLCLPQRKGKRVSQLTFILH